MNDFLMMLSVILLSMLMILLSTLNDQTFVLRQQLKLASELESDLGDTGLGRNGQEVACSFQYWKNSACLV